MQMASATLVLLLACCIAGSTADGIQDSQALLQAEVHQTLENNNPGTQMLLSRKIATPDPGSNIEFHLSPGCKTSDEHGENDCEIPFGSSIKVKGGLRLSSGLHRGDRLVIRGSSTGRASPSAPDFLQEALRFQATSWSTTCGLCAGTCSVSASGKNGFKMSIQMPTFVQHPTECAKLDSHQKTEVTIPELNLPTLPMLPLAWGLSGELDMTMAVENSAGAPRVSEDIHLKIRPPDGAAASLLSTHPAVSTGSILMQVGSGMAQVGEQLGLKTGARSLFGVLHETLAGGLAEAFSQHRPKGATERSIDASTVRVEFSNFDGTRDSNVTLFAGKSCMQDTCKIPFGRPTTFSGSAHVSMDLDPGSYMTVSVKPEIGGMMGKMMRPMLKPMLSMFPLKLPLCGDSTVSHTLMGKEISYMPAPCGHYIVDVDSPATTLNVPDIASLKFSQFGIPKMPMLPDRLADMPSHTMKISYGLKHADGSPIVDVSLEYGAGHA